jgi:hypothetical protein
MGHKHRRRSQPQNEIETAESKWLSMFDENDRCGTSPASEWCDYLFVELCNQLTFLEYTDLHEFLNEVSGDYARALYRSRHTKPDADTIHRLMFKQDLLDEIVSELERRGKAPRPVIVFPDGSPSEVQ